MHLPQFSRLGRSQSRWWNLGLLELLIPTKDFTSLCRAQVWKLKFNKKTSPKCFFIHVECGFDPLTEKISPKFGILFSRYAKKIWNFNFSQKKLLLPNDRPKRAVQFWRGGRISVLTKARNFSDESPKKIIKLKHFRKNSQSSPLETYKVVLKRMLNHISLKIPRISKYCCF